MPLLLCDLDDTLIDRASAFAAWSRDFAARHGIGEEHLPWIRDLDDRGFLGRPEYLAAVRERFGLRETVERMLDDYARRYPAFVGPPDEGTLRALRRARETGWRIGVVTNGAHLQEEKLIRSGLLDHVDGCAISDLVGHRKPDPAIFRVAAQRCGASLDGAWMVGDHGPADIAGAAALGLGSVWLRHGREWPFTGYRPTHAADSFAEAVDLILGGR